MGARALPVLLAMALAAACHKEAAQAPQPAPQPDATASPAAETTAVRTEATGKPTPKATFTALATGQTTDLAAFKGKPLLVNLWATWCVPCVRELPALDRLAAAESGRLQIVAVSEDLEGKTVVPPFLAGHGVKTLAAYHDPNNALMTELKEASLPVTILYDAGGKEVWRVSGGLDWNGARAKALLAQAGA